MTLGCVCGTIHPPQLQPGGTGIVDKTGGYVGLARAAGPPESDITLTSNAGDVLLVQQQGVVCGIVKSAEWAGQFERSSVGSHNV